MNLREFWNFKLKAAEEEPDENSAQEDEAELVDPQDELRASCGQKRKMIKLYDTLATCNKRVNSRQKTQETCAQELFDYVQAVDNCVAETLFSKLA